ncbi:MAG: hypothetical protein JO333_20760 [Verrucomicrobia bacterium]|nr:hypothetical protein [Verrucomicrobiota bacterium]
MPNIPISSNDADKMQTASQEYRQVSPRCTIVVKIAAIPASKPVRAVKSNLPVTRLSPLIDLER